ncbi:transaldolase family protein [Desulfohalovibrio reitneri]|uniref:transaldolase family protein n=1 Tax=Desulfohalovibrio reitneri TaxID=1307759 RepID=UPI0004A6EB69|nr:transaldolase family protein [Desulfohalovibrio reitneri]
MRPEGLTTQIFVDGGDPEETRRVKDKLGFLDGQTTNPSFVAKNPEAKKRLEKGERFSEKELLAFYRDTIVKEIEKVIPGRSISIEVHADDSTPAERMLEQAREMATWTPNAQIKFPTTTTGIEAAVRALQEDIPVNMTLCFQQAQAAAVHSATRGAKKGDVFVSPFVGRLYDRGENGMDLIANIRRMYNKVDSHVLLLAASLRDLDQLLQSILLGADIATCKPETLMQWADEGMHMPPQDFSVAYEGAKAIPYQHLDPEKDWRSFDLSHPKLDEGLEKFSADWTKLLK